MFTPKIGEDSHFDNHIFQMGWFNHQPVTTLTTFQGPWAIQAIHTLTEPGLPLPRDGSNTLIFRPFCAALMIELRYSRYDVFVYDIHFISTKLGSSESKCM